MPDVARQPAVPGRPLRLGRVVAERRRDDGARAFEQRLGMARDLGLGHREPHPPEEPARAPLADVPLGVDVRLGARDADGVEPELLREPLNSAVVTARIVHRGIVHRDAPRPPRPGRSAHDRRAAYCARRGSKRPCRTIASTEATRLPFRRPRPRSGRRRRPADAPRTPGDAGADGERRAAPRRPLPPQRPRRPPRRRGRRGAPLPAAPTGCPAASSASTSSS